MDELYREFILDHYKNPRNFGELEPHDVECFDRNPLCGDEMGVHIQLEGDRIADLRFHGQGCAISQASASIISDELKGKTVSEVADAGPELRRRGARARALPHPPQVRPARPEGRPGSAARYGRVADGYARRGPAGRGSGQAS